MTSSERVRRAVLFQEPDRVPIDLPEPWGSDFIWVGPATNPILSVHPIEAHGFCL